MCLEIAAQLAERVGFIGLRRHQTSAGAILPVELVALHRAHHQARPCGGNQPQQDAGGHQPG
ncbi:hypothetical protein BN874_340001 [Candidatus Contendobacter odensis Run_B_J11]|uniref:Uncharacterized protein n=1 Tax=Candidatus Contendobacter odensis Run_B_J11 TaxID=1400861 RepID=A0A7U7J578_9GAMM|nr:hypothetical protein BN874_340001 [Candidatus Contendobacter odensis Run_B_J11]